MIKLYLIGYNINKIRHICCILYLVGYNFVMETKINEIIKQKRREAGLNQIEFADRIGIGLATIRDIEQGKLTVKLSSLYLVIEALNLKLKLEEK